VVQLVFADRWRAPSTPARVSSVHDVDIEDDFGRFLVEMAKSLKLAGAVMRELTGLAAGDYRHLVVNNYCLSTVRVLAYQLGFDVKQLWLDNVPRFSHAHVADILVNLADMAGAGVVSPGDRVMALGSGPVTWGLMSLRRVDRQS